MRNFVGRQACLKLLEGLWKSPRTKLVAIYGRRRVGKTELIRRFGRGKKVFFFEALEGEETSAQVKHFLFQLSDVCREPHLRDLDYGDWQPAFDLLSQKMEKEPRLVLVFDELPWMAAGRGKLASYVKFYWDKKWKDHPHLLLILCGSVTSWMVKNVVRSKALYGRISESILVDPLEPHEVAEFIGARRGTKEIVEYLMCFGGIPRYLEEFDFTTSIQVNIERTCFRRSGFFVDEAEKIFYSQFRETHLYKQIVALLLKGPLNFQEIADRLKLQSGGGLKRYLDNLVLAGIVEGIPRMKDFRVGKTPRYYLADELLRFHATFIAPHADKIRHVSGGIAFEEITQGVWSTFTGFAFERFCLRHRYTIADVMEFRPKVAACGPVAKTEEGGYQYDLVYLRRDGVITVCEVKYLAKPPQTKLIQEMERKLSRTKFPRGMTVERVLISNQEPSAPLRESGYFHRIVLAQEIIRCGKG